MGTRLAYGLGGWRSPVVVDGVRGGPAVHHGGVVARGAIADLIVVDRDPTAIPATDVRRAKVQATILAGEVAQGDLGVG